MTLRNYSNTAVQTTLTAGISAGALSLTVADATGYPAVPFAIVLDAGSATDEEVVFVTAKVGTTFTITRGADGTTAKAHASGATVIHAAIAGDFTDLQAAGLRYTYATGTLTLAVQPAVGDTITVGSLTYTYIDTFTFPGPGDIVIGVDLAETQANTVSSVNQGVGTTFPDAGATAFSGNVSIVVSAAVGTAGNGVVTTSVFTNAANHFDQASLAGGMDGTDSGHIQAQTSTLTGSSAAAPILRIQSAPGTDEFAQENIVDIVDGDGNPLINVDGGGNFYTFRDMRLVDPDHSATFRVGADKKVYIRIADTEGPYQVWIDSDPDDILIFSLRPFASKTVQINAASAGSVALEIDAAGIEGDTTDLIQVYGNFNFDLVFRLMQSGAVVIAQHVAPGDAQLNTGDMALWFDQTPSAAKLMIKAKDSDGTVVTGEVALT
jgi:hypothetical protein